MNSEHLKKQASDFIDSFLENSFEKLDYSLINTSSTAVIVVDMLNGFAKSGNLYSDRVEKIILNTKLVLEKLSKAEMVFICDAHTDDSAEFSVFPKHCIESTEESEIADELLPFSKESTIIYKNSTNGFLEPEFTKWLDNNDIKDYIIIGCCTDLCISQLAITLKTHFNRINKHVNIFIPIEAVETYDLSITNHPGDFMNLVALKQMSDNGIKIVNGL